MTERSLQVEARTFRSARASRLAVGLAATAIAATAWSAVGESQSPGAGAGAQASATSAAGAISGRVLDESNGAPIAGAVVSLRWAGSAKDPIGLPPLDAQATDQVGRFLFARVPAGRSFELLAAKPGYFDGVFGARTPERVVVADGQWLRDVNILLSKPAAISGTILDEAGEPIVGVHVQAIAHILVGGEPAFGSGPLTRTDDRGMYRLAPLTPGAYAVAVLSVPVSVPADARMEALSIHHVLPAGGGHMLIGFEGSALARATPGTGRRHAYATTFYPAASTIATAAVVDLTSGDDRIGVDVQLRAAGVSRVSGRVTGPPDAITDRRLRLLPAGAEHMGVGGEAGIALTSADGTFTFLDVPDGEYSILAASGALGYDYHPPALLMPTLHPMLAVAGRYGFQSQPSGSAIMAGSVTGRSSRAAPTIRATSWALSENDRFLGRARVSVSGADVSNVIVPLHDGATIRGRFVIDTPADRARIVELSPYLDMVAEPAGAEPFVREIRAGVTPGSAGLNFTFSGVPPGTYALRFLGTYAMVKSVTWSGRDATGLPFFVTDPAIPDLVVTLTTQVAGLGGTVRDADGRVAARGAVLYFPVDPARWRLYGPQPDRLGAVSLASNGVFSIPRLPAGDFLVVAVDERLADGWKDPAFLAAAARAGTRVTLEWGETRTQDLTMTTIAP